MGGFIFRQKMLFQRRAFFDGSNMNDVINRVYLKTDISIELNKAFYSNKKLPSITLKEFFDEYFYRKIKTEIGKLKFRKEKIPLAYSYSKVKIPKILSKFLQSKEFLDFINDIIQYSSKKISREGNFFCFKWKDYTILNDELKEKAGIDVIIDFTDDWDERFGGSVVYVDGSGEYFKILPSGNAVTLVHRKENVQRFVQYVNHLSDSKKRYFILGKLD